MALLDQGISSTVHRAFAMKKLYDAYAGFCIRVKRLSDNATLDVGFNSAGNVDVDLILTWAVGASVVVIRWYDQSGNTPYITPVADIPFDTATGSLRISSPTDNYSHYFSLGNLSALTEGEAFLHRKIDVDPIVAHQQGGPWYLGTDPVNNSLVPYFGDVIYDDFGSTVRKDAIAYSSVSRMNVWHVYGAYSKTNDWANFLNGHQLHQTGTNTVGFPASARLGGTPGNYMSKGLMKAFILFSQKVKLEERTVVTHGLLETQTLLPSGQNSGCELYCDAQLVKQLADGASLTAYPDHSGKGRHLIAASSYPTYETNEVNGKPTARWNGSQNPLYSNASFTLRCGWIVARHNGASFADYKGLLTGNVVADVLVGNNSGTNFFNTGNSSFEFRSNDRIYPRTAAPAPMNAYAIIFFRFWTPLAMDGVQLAQQKTFTTRKWNGEVPFVALYSRDFTEEEIRQHTQTLATHFNRTLANVYPYQADFDGHDEQPEQTVNFYDPPEGDRISEAVDDMKRVIELTFSVADETEIRTFETFRATHYAAALPFIYRDYRVTPPQDLEGYMDSIGERSGGNNLGSYKFAFREK